MMSIVSMLLVVMAMSVAMSMLVQVSLSANASLVVLEHLAVLDAHPAVKSLLLVHADVHGSIVTEEISQLFVGLGSDCKLFPRHKYPARKAIKSSRLLCGLEGAPNLFLNSTESA
jgi:hypothetical protein